MKHVMDGEHTARLFVVWVGLVLGFFFLFVLLSSDFFVGLCACVSVCFGFGVGFLERNKWRERLDEE